MTTTETLNEGRERFAIEARGVSRAFGGYEALHTADLAVLRGEHVAIMGPSGCGKTTLLNILGGIDRPDAGSVAVGGEQIRYGDRELTHLHRTAIGFVFQGYGLIPSLTAMENVEFTMLANGVGAEQRRARSLALLGAVGLEGYVDRYPEELSGGQRQRVAVARSLAHSPAVVLADEPTGNLDGETGTQVMAVLIRACRERGAALVVVTHDVEVAAQMQRVVHMKYGRVVVANDLQLPHRLKTADALSALAIAGGSR